MNFLKTIRFHIKKYFIFKKFKFHFCVYLTEHCNLNCQMCNTFSPIAEPAYYNVEHYEIDCEKLSKLLKKRTHKIILMGGEPLLHPELVKFMKITRKLFPSYTTKIELLTNGILLLSMSDEFWQTIKKYNIELTLTKYPIDLDYKKIEQKACTYNIDISYHKGFIGEIERKSYKYNLDETGSQDIKNAYYCKSGSVSVLKYGKLYKCPICASINNFNQYFNKNLERVDADYIDLANKHKINDIFMFLYKPSPFCRYCIVKKNGETIVTDWDFSKKDIKEWT